MHGYGSFYKKKIGLSDADFFEFRVASSFSTLCLTIQNYFHNMEAKEFMKNSFTKSITDFTLLSLYGMHYPLHASASALGKIPYLVTDVKFVLLFLTMLKLVKTEYLNPWFTVFF